MTTYNDTADFQDKFIDDDEEGWFVNPAEPDWEIKIEVLENGDTLVGGRHRWRDQNTIGQSLREKYFGEGSSWETLEGETDE